MLITQFSHLQQFFQTTKTTANEKPLDFAVTIEAICLAKNRTHLAGLAYYLDIYISNCYDLRGVGTITNQWFNYEHLKIWLPPTLLFLFFFAWLNNNNRTYIGR